MRALALAAIASAFVAGCAVSPPDNTFAYHPGIGTVEGVQSGRVAIPGGSLPQTALGKLTSPRWVDGYQLTLRMDDGATQAITQDSGGFQAGDRVQVTPTGRVLRLPQGSGATGGTR